MERVQTYLDGEVTSVDVISQEEVPGVGRVASNFKQLHQVELRAREEGRQQPASRAARARVRRRRVVQQRTY